MKGALYFQSLLGRTLSKPTMPVSREYIPVQDIHCPAPSTALCEILAALAKIIDVFFLKTSEEVEELRVPPDPAK